jgi:hypothetical protein
MGAGTGNRNNMDAARRQQAMEGQSMRRRAIEQQELNLLQMQEQMVFPEYVNPTDECQSCCHSSTFNGSQS